MRPSELPRVLTIAGARRQEISRKRVRTELANGRWHRLTTGVYLTRPDPPTRYDWIHAGLAVAPPGSVLSGWDVLRKYRIGPVNSPGDVLILMPHGENRRLGPVRMRTSGRPLQRGEFSVLDAELPHVPHAGVARAVADTALQLREFMPIRAMVTSAVQRKLVTPDELAMELVHCPRNHSAFFRQAMTDVLGGAKSVAEAEAVAVLRGRRDVPRFEVNARIDAGGRVFEADVLWPELKVVLEIDSREFHFSEREWKATMARHNLLSRLGYVVLHYPPSVIRRDPKAWADEVAACLRVRRAELLRPLINTA